MKTIDHDPNEHPRPDKGEQIFVTVVTIVVLSGLALGLNALKDAFGLAIGLAGCASVLAIAFAVAFALERSKGRRRG